MRLISLIILFIPSLLMAQLPGLQGPFVPIEVESVSSSGNGASVQMLFEAPTTAGTNVYAAGSVFMDEASTVQQAQKKMEDPNGGGIRDRFDGDGWNYDPGFGGPAGDFKKETDDPPEQYLLLGYCGSVAPENAMNLGDCKQLTDDVSPSCGEVNQGSEICYVFEGLSCAEDGSEIVYMRYTIDPPFGPDQPGRLRGQWIPPASFDMCYSDNPGAPLPDLPDPSPEPNEFMDYMKGDPAPLPNPFAPDPLPPSYPPPMSDPDFYREADTPFFDMGLPSSPTPLALSQQMTSDYASFTSTAAPGSNPLPQGMSFQPPPAGGSGEYGSPRSSYGLGGSGTGGAALGSGSIGGGGSGEGEGNTPNICQTNPEALACVNTNVGDEIVPTITPDTVDAGFDLTPVALSSVSGCPAPLSMDFMGQPYSIEYTIICDYGSSVSPLILLFAAVSAGMIILGIRGVG